MRGRLLNNYAYAAVDELQAYRASLQVELSEESAMLNQLRSPGTDPKAKEKIDAEYQGENRDVQSGTGRPAQAGSTRRRRNIPSSARTKRSRKSWPRSVKAGRTSSSSVPRTIFRPM